MRPHFPLFLIVGLIVVFFFGGFLGDYYITQQRITTHYLQIFEKKSWQGLDVLHEGVTRLTEDFFTQNVRIMESLSTDPGLLAALADKDYAGAEAILDRQRQVNQRFNGYEVLDAQGNVLLNSSDNPQATQFIGSNFSDRQYFKDVMATKSLTVSTVLSSATPGRSVIAVAVPIVNSRREITQVLSAFLVLPTLAQKINLESNFQGFATTVTDGAGNIILDSNEEVQGIVNIKDKSRIVERLLNGETEPREDEYNWRGERVLARGSAVKVGPRQFFVISYYNKAQFDGELVSLRQEFADLFSQLLVRGLVFGMPLLFLIAFILYRHDAAAHHSS